MRDSGVCPWCQTIQAFTFYGRQRCQICSKPLLVTPDDSDGDILQNHISYWSGILQELSTMEVELDTLGLAPRKMIAEITRRIERLTASTTPQFPYSPRLTSRNPDQHKEE